MSTVQTKKSLVPFWIVLLLALVAVYISISTGQISKWDFYNSDALYLPLFYDDISSEYSLLGWLHPPAPYFFPDLMLYSIIRLFVENVHLTIMGFGVVQSLLCILGFLYLGRLIFGPQNQVSPLILTGGTIFFLCLATGQCQAFIPILQSGFHFGTILNLLLSVALVVHILKNTQTLKKTGIYALILGLLAPVMLLSDGLYLVQFILPMLLTILVLFLSSQISAHQGLFVYAALLPAIPLNMEICRRLLIFRNIDHPMHGPPVKNEIVPVLSKTIRHFWNTLDHYWFSPAFQRIFGVVWVIFVVIWLVLLVYSLKKMWARENAQHHNVVFFLVSGLFGISFLAGEQLGSHWRHPPSFG